MNDKIVVFGGNGQVGSALGELLGNRAIMLKRDDADFTNLTSLRTILEKLQPTSVINAVAYTAVDKAEEEEKLATIINADAPKIIAEYCKEQNIPFIHYSTDYVFAGDGDLPRSTDEQTNPINAYGRSKLAGERNITGIGGQYIIFRTSWVYDAKGKNFLNTMLHLAANREDLSIISDQVGAPSYALHIAQATIQALDYVANTSNFPHGIYHLCG
jgi:dTDP-4-dehydrorhamnose reductase